MPNEWNITAEAATWVTEICTARPDLPFEKATVEVTVKGKNTRHDLTLYDRDGKKVLTGEVKRPENPDGRNPMSDALLTDAFMKASATGTPYFFTWNVNRCVLFDSLKNAPLTERSLEHFYVLQPPIKTSKELESGHRAPEIKKFLTSFLERLAAITRGEDTLGTLPLDEIFLLKWEAALEQPVAQTYSALLLKYGEANFTGELNAWMRDKQGMTLSDDPDTRNENLERSAKLACYVLANRILFYKALRKNPTFRRLRKFQISADIKTGTQFKKLIDEFFNNARTVTRDYETIFGGNEFGDTLPFISDSAVDAWRDLSAGTDDFDFTQLGFEIIGQIFERLLSTEERHKFGQHYTRSEVVDLINAFCIRDADATVFDPACGGGTFLVRAYARKKLMAAGTLSHQELLPQLIGNDISAYPAHLTTINLATRDLIDKANYPFVLRGDFFDFSPGQAAFKLPLSANLELAEQTIPEINAFVGNPPYIRQEKISEHNGAKYKTRLLDMAKKVAPAADFSARSDIHCYFFPHAMQFLAADGWMGFLVSSSWLDTGYGFRLQKFLLDHFRIVALVESAVEPWFTGARVTTVAVILQRENDAAKRAQNTVRFVWAKKPLNELIPATGDEAERQHAFEALRDDIENATDDDEFEMPLPQGATCKVGQTALRGWRIRSIAQGDLEQLGFTGIAAADDEDETEENKQSAVKAAHELGAPEYSGSKWGLFLRAPDIFFGLLKAGKGRFAPLGALADVKFGVKSGCDAFFFPRDVTNDVMSTLSPEEMKARYGLSPADTKKIRLIESGDRTRHVIEAKFLEPEIHGLMDIQKAELFEKDLEQKVVLIPTSKIGFHRFAREYVAWGENEGFNKGSTCKSRESQNRKWFDLTGRKRGSIIWPKLQQYRHVVAFNPHGFSCNCNLYDVFSNSGVDDKVLCASLNSTVAALFRFIAGTQMGREGNQVTEIKDVKMMLVADPRGATESAKARVLAAFETMKTREIGALVDVDGSGPEYSGELAHADRQELDDATLELLGVQSAKERTRLRDALYQEITTLYREIRLGEREMQGHRSKNNRRAAPTAQTLAKEIWDSLAAPPTWKLPADFLEADEPTEVFDIEPGKAKIKDASLVEGAGVQIGNTFHETGDMKRAAYLEAHAKHQIWGKITVPVNPAASEVAIESWLGIVSSNTELFEAEARARTVDEKLQARIVSELWKLTRIGAAAP
jgi:type I restriction-modification system DNA methylase subunit